MSDDEYAIELTPYEVTQGKEQLVQSADGTTYAGEWMRSLLDEAEEDEVLLGHFDDPVRGSDEPARLPMDALFRHMGVFGLTGYGKSTFLVNHLLQLAERDAGFCFLDPKESAAKDVLARLPDSRLDDVVWVDPMSDDAVRFNLFETYNESGTDQHESEVQRIVNDLLAILKEEDSAWGVSMDSLVTAVATSLVRAEEEYTLLDMYEILSDDAEREKFVEKFGDELEPVYSDRLTEYSEVEFDPVIRRIDRLVNNQAVRNSIATRGGLSFGEMVKEDKIVLVDLSTIPDSWTTSLVATAFARGIWAGKQATFHSSDDRTPYFLAFDEFDMLVTDKMAIGELMSKGRSLQLGVILANQNLEQLPESVRESVMGLVGNIFTFNPGPSNVSEAGRLAQIYEIGANRLTHLTLHEFVGRLITRDGQPTEPFTISCIASLPPRRDSETVDQVINGSVETYGHSGGPDLDSDLE